MKITEINITPVKPNKGLVAFASCVVADCIYLGSIGIMSRPNGKFRLTFPTKKIGSRNINIYHPITKKFGSLIKSKIIAEYENVMKKTKNDRYSSLNA